MRPARAIEELRALKQEAEIDPDVRRSGPMHDSWKAKTDAVLVRSLGPDSETLAEFRRVRYRLPIYSGAPGSAERAARHFADAVDRAAGLIDAAIYELGLQGGDEPVDEQACDPELWDHVKTLVEDEEWGKVASQTAIFVENRIRTWAGNPQGKNGNNLVGKALYVEVFGDASAYRLGRRASECEGWRALGIGLRPSARQRGSAPDSEPGRCEALCRRRSRPRQPAHDSTPLRAWRHPEDWRVARVGRSRSERITMPVPHSPDLGICAPAQR
jgi:hypothetical protein